MKRFNKAIARLLTAVFLFSAFFSLPFANITEVYAITTQAMVQGGSVIDTDIINYNGNDIGADAYITVDGVTYPAFCVDSILGGAHVHPNGQYPVNISGTNSNPKVATVLHNTMPYKTKDDILALYPGLTDAQIYAASKAAIRAVADQSASQYQYDDKWGGDPQTVAFAKHLISLAKSATEDVPKLAAYGVTDSSEVTTDGDFFVKSTTVSSAYPLADGTKIKLTLPPNAPVGTVIAYEDGTPIPADGVDNNIPIKVMIPINSVSENESGSIEIGVAFSMWSAVILFGEPVDAEDVGKYQRYEISMPLQSIDFTFPMEYKGPPTEDETSTPTNTPNPEPEFGGLKIVKYDNVTGQLAPDAIFEIRGLDDHNNEILIQAQGSSGATVPSAANGATVTLGDGTVTVSGIPAGKYNVTEISPPPHYDMSPDMVYSKVVEVVGETDATVYPQVTFRNNPYGKLQITKIDAVTGEPLADALLRIRNDIADIDITRRTDGSGIITLEDLPQGNYAITEENAGADYELNPATVVVPVRWGELTEVTYDNQPHTSLEVTKINTKTNEPVTGAVFTLTELETGKQWTQATLSGGKAVFSNLTAGEYTVQEIFVPEPLILDSTIVNIQLDNDKINTYTVKNDEKPIVILEKYDEKTGELLGGAEFRLEQLDGAWQTEFILDSSGKKSFTVNPGTYQFTEIAAPDGYLIVTKHKDFVVNPNDEIVIKFDNRPRPKLRILKVDAITGEPLPNAEFRVTKTEDKTVSEYITDESGELLIEDLDEAIYTVEEFMPPDGYILYEESKEIALEWGMTKTLKFDNIRKPTLIVTKLNGLTNRPVPGATYEIKYESPDGGVIPLGSYLTDENGQIVIPKANAGWYSVTETKAAPGFSLPSNPTTRMYLEPGENAYLGDGIGTGNESGTYGEDYAVMSGNDFTPTLSATGQLVYDWPLNSVVIKKTHAVTGELLSGAAFELYRADEQVSGIPGTNIGRFITDNSGIVVITGLQPGYYIVREAQAPPNFMISENSQQNGFLKADGTTVLEFTFANIPYGSLLITKVDAQTLKPLPNARFRVTHENGAVAGNSNGEYITNENGEVLIENLVPNAYVVTEIEAPEFYTIDTTPQTVQIGTDGKTYKVSFKDQPSATLVIRKLDTASNEPLEGAEFKVTTSGGNVIGTSNGVFKTDATGTITIPHLQKGTYIVEEIKAPTDYILENQSQTVEIDYGKTYTLDFYNKHMSGLQIIKIDSVTKQPIKGAEFAVYKQNGEIIGRYTTDANGVIIIDTLNPGWYKAVETKTLPGYLLDDTPMDFEITNNQFVKLVFENEPMSGLLIRKLDADTREPLEGAEFTVENANGLMLGVYRSGTDGTAYLPNLEPGWYTVTETKAPEGYTLGDNVKTVEITTVKTVTIEFENRPFGSLVIKKLDEVTGNPLTGAQFKVSHQNGEFVGEYTTDKDGTINIPSVAPGWYSIGEIKAPSGYILDNTAKTAEVKPIVPTEVTFTNVPLSGLEIIKTDSVTHNPLPNATFTVERSNGERVGTYKTDAAGKIIVPELPEGIYVVSETIAPDGYILNESPKNVTVVADKLVTVEFTNEPHSGIQIIKTDSKSKKPLSGAVFKIDRVNGERIGDKYKTDVAGKILVPDLPEDVYIISEIEAPKEYILDALPQTVEVKTGKLTIAEFTNTPYPYLYISKKDASSGKLLSGAKFTVTQSTGGVIANVTSQASGPVAIKVAPGIYTITEVQAPNGYELNNPVQTVEIRAGENAVYSSVSNSATFENKPYNSLEIIKLDAVTKRPLSSATFKVENTNGDDLGDFITDNDGKILITEMPEGIYIVSEIDAPSGYMLTEIPQTVNLGDGRLVSIEFLNRPLSGIQVLKIDSVTRKPLPGATFSVTKADGTAIGSYKTDADGMAVINGLDEGDYVVGEINAPVGYELDDTPKNVTVKSGALTMVEFTNNPLSGIEILKTDAVTRVPLADATFTVESVNSGLVSTYKTDNAGKILVTGLEEGSYIVSETIAPVGYMLTETPQTVPVVTGRLTTVEFTNRPLSGIQITKLDAENQRPLQDAAFSVSKADGTLIGTFRTEADGKVIVPDLEEGVYVVGETAAPAGYILDETPKNVTVESGKLAAVDFVNRPLSGIEIVKLDSVTHDPLQGAAFSVTKADGENIGTYRTEADGKVLVTGLDEGVYVVGEISAPDGYVIDEVPKNVTVISGKLARVEFVNKPLSGIEIIKLDDANHTPLEGASFKVERSTGEIIGMFKTDVAGKVLVTGLDEGTYVVSETAAPDGYILSSTPMNVTVISGRLTPAEFTNRKLSGMQILKVDANTQAPLKDAVFTVYRMDNSIVGTYTTDANGVIVLNELPPDWYKVAETQAPQGYLIDDTAKDVEITSDQFVKLVFENRPMAGLIVKKMETGTLRPLSGAAFTVKQQDGRIVGDYTTGADGTFSIPTLEPGWYTASETKAPEGFILDDNTQTFEITDSGMVTLEFLNRPLSGIEILKLDAVTNAPLSGATFTVERDNGEQIGTYKTDLAGKILVSDLSEGTFIVSETIAPNGYTRDEIPKTVVVTSGKLAAVEFRNKPLSGIEILKINAVTKEPLMGATFEVERPNGESVGSFKTDAAGKIIVPDLPEGTYIISETAAPEGFMLSETPKTVEVVSGRMTQVEFTNKPFSGIEVIKLDSQTNEPLSEASFLLERDNGERIGTYETDSTGKFIVSDLAEGTYILSETAAPDGYILDESPKTVIVTSGKLTTVEFFNKPLAGLKIIKLNEETRRPIEGVEFEITAMSGDKVENGFRGYTFKTDRTGQIYIPDLPNGYYTVTETKSAEGYIIDGEPKTVLIESGKPTVLEVLNTPASGLLIVKTDKATGEPLQGVVFDVRRADGQFVSGTILDENQPDTYANSPNKTTMENGDITGSYTTDANGRILINSIDAGEYQIIERKALDGYELDKSVHTVTVTPGKLATVQITNEQKAGLRILKIDAFTKKPIFGVEFMVFDEGKNVVGTYYTDDRGLIDFTGILTEGKYTLRETKAAEGYYLDDLPRTVEFKSGQVTEIRWENTPQLGQVQILKKSGDANEINGLPEDSPLEGAVFEIYQYKSGNLVDRFISGSDGRAVSQPLPLGRYTIKEVKAPQWYRASTETLDVEIEFATQIIKHEFVNYSANTGVSVKKTGIVEAMPGDEIRYDIKELKNTSTVQLTDFYWRDVIPTDAVRLTKIVTGTYNQSLKYKIIATTNSGETKVVADNLSTTQNNVIDFSNASLGLKNDEYVTSFTVVFGTVNPGFTIVEAPQVYVRVLNGLQTGYQFSNKTDVGGMFGSEWVVGNSTWLTSVYSPVKLPKTGY